MIGPVRAAWLSALAGVLMMLAGGASACTVTTTVPSNLGTYSPAAVRAAAVPALQSQGGLTCTTALITLLANNYLRATFNSQNGLLLKQQGGTASVAYVASADANGTYRFGQGVTIDYMQNNLLNLLGLLGGSSANLPFFVRPAGGTTLPAGSYTDKITMDWTWYQCPGIGALGACVGTPDSGSGRATITVTMIVSPQNVILSVGSTVTWDPVNATNHPKALPGARLRTSIYASNPDIVPLDAGSLALILPTDGKLAVALDGDGTSSTAVTVFTEGSPASGVTLTYNGPGDMTDDVDFSSDGGATWTYVPVAGNVTSEAAVTHVRLRPRGSMAKQSAFSISLPYLVR